MRVRQEDVSPTILKALGPFAFEYPCDAPSEWTSGTEGHLPLMLRPQFVNRYFDLLMKEMKQQASANRHEGTN